MHIGAPPGITRQKGAAIAPIDDTSSRTAAATILHISISFFGWPVEEGSHLITVAGNCRINQAVKRRSRAGGGWCGGGARRSRPRRRARFSTLSQSLSRIRSDSDGNEVRSMSASRARMVSQSSPNTSGQSGTTVPSGATTTRSPRQPPAEAQDIEPLYCESTVYRANERRRAMQNS
jgi:hypothetical protein